MAVKLLNPKQQSFCREYVKDFNATQSAIRAGYSKKTAKVIGYENLTKPYISVFLSNLMDKQAEKAEITVEWIIKELKQMYERCQSTLSAPGAIAGATKQLELLGKHIGMWIDRSELTINIKEVNVMVVQIQGVIAKHIPDAEVRNRIAEDLKELGL